MSFVSSSSYLSSKTATRRILWQFGLLARMISHEALGFNPVSFKVAGSFGPVCVRVHIAYGNSSIGCKPL